MNLKNTMINMATKDEMINFFVDGLKESFVSKYDDINNSKDTVNEYMKNINFNYQYDYNTFCSEFIKYTTDKLEKVNEEDMPSINITKVISDVLVDMIKNKIYDNVKDEQERATLMMIHELKKYLMKKGN